MATFFGPPPFVSHPMVRTQHLFSSSQPPPPLPPSQPPSQQLPLSKSSKELQPPLPVASDRGGKGRGTSADSTDWIASSLTRRFGLGAGLAWAGFIAFGIVSEQIKTRLEVTQQEANTRFVSTKTNDHEWYLDVSKCIQVVLIILENLTVFCNNFLTTVILLLQKQRTKTHHYPKLNIMILKVDPFFRICASVKRLVQLLQRCRDGRGGGVT